MLFRTEFSTAECPFMSNWHLVVINYIVLCRFGRECIHGWVPVALELTPFRNEIHSFMPFRTRIHPRLSAHCSWIDTLCAMVLRIIAGESTHQPLHPQHGPKLNPRKSDVPEGVDAPKVRETLVGHSQSPTPSWVTGLPWDRCGRECIHGWVPVALELTPCMRWSSG